MQSESLIIDPRIILFEDLPFMAYARKASLESTYHHKIGVVIANKKTVLATGFNQLRHKRFGNRFRAWPESLHGEIDALTKVNRFKLEGAEVYIYRENKNNIPVISYPCENCYEALKWAKVKKIYFTIEDSKLNYWDSIKV